MSKLLISKRLEGVNLGALDLDLDLDISWQAILEETSVLADGEQLLKREISLSFVSEKEIQELNKGFLGKDKVTDVLSFPMSLDMPLEEDLLEEIPLGDIIICVQRAIDQAKEYGHSQKREFAFLFVHGLLHLLGYDHIEEKDADEMFGLQDKVLDKLGIAR